jgi:hypothetical protein
VAGRRAVLASIVAAALAAPHRVMAEAAFDDEDIATATALRERAMADTQAWRLVESLVTEVGARPAGSPADARAVAWAQARMTSLGLASVRAEPFPIRVWQRGPGEAMLTAPVPQRLVMTALGNSPATPEGGLEAELAVYPDFAALAADTSERARGRIVFIDQHTERTIDGRGYGSAVRARFAGPLEASKRGALATVIRSIGTDRDRIAHTGAMGIDAKVKAIPGVAVSAPDADLIARLHASGQTLRIKLAVQARQGIEATTHNVIGEIPGSDLAEEIVLISAHLDSWDVGQGALDDGAGVAIVLAAARQLLDAPRRPRRTVRVVLFGNEENGLDGARHYGDRYAGVRHQFVGESDFGAGKAWRLRSRVREDALPALRDIAGVLQPIGIAAGGNDATPGPDAGLLMRRHRWPGIELSQDGNAYFDVHHSDNDTLDKIDAAALPQNVAAWAVTAWLAAQSRLSF